MSINKLTQDYNNRRIELVRRIEICKKAKIDIAEFVKKLNKDYDHGLISDSAYNNKLDSFLKGKTIEEWIEYYDDSIDNYEKELENCESELIIRKINLRGVITVILIILAIGIGMFALNPSITGYFVANEPVETFRDGYGIEDRQNKWADINGNMIYTRCLKIRSEIEFNELIINAKITSTRDNKNLYLGLYSHNNESDEPLEKLYECRVKDYSDIWKSCGFNLENQPINNYWICTYVPSGNANVTYFKIAYQRDNSKKRALWTGGYWQKLEQASFTMKAEFIKW